MRIKRVLYIYTPCLMLVFFVYTVLDVLSFAPRKAAIDAGTDPVNVYKGAIHIHSVHSDGGGTVREIAQAAEQAGLDFVIISDHDASSEARDKAGYYGNVLVMIGSEVSLPEAHVLYIPHPDSVFHPIDDLKENLYSYRDQAFIAIAHPFLPKRPLEKDTAHLTDGIELVNADEIWRIASKFRLLQAFVMYPFYDYSMNTLIYYPENNMNLWKSKVSAGYQDMKFIGSVDAHAKIKITRNRSWGFPSYERVFKVVQTHIISDSSFNGDYKNDARIVYDALENGSSFVIFENLGSASGFEFSAWTGDSVKIIGSDIEYSGVDSLCIKINSDDKIRIYLKTPGKTVSKIDGSGLTFIKPEKGIYYAEIYQVRRMLPFGIEKELPWIITNPIILN